MSMEETIMSPFSVFESVQETYEDAVKKSAEESNARMKRFAMDKVGTYSVRILPIAPVQQPDGTWKLDRKGYEYPIKTLVLNIDNANVEQGDKKKKKNIFVNVCHTKYVGLTTDLIDTYVNVAEIKYGNDAALIKKIKANSFEGGIRWNSQRIMYILDCNARAEGIQQLSLSFSQYKELEERKLAVWKKLLDKNPKTACPISSITDAYPVEIIRKEENKKVSYAFNIDTLSGHDSLSEEEVNTLLSTTRIPDNNYRYTNFHLEATVEFLKQFDAKMGISVMKSNEIKDAIAKIKMELPSDDKSHFTFDRGGEHSENSESDGELTYDSLCDRYDDLAERGVGDKSDEGQELRDDIRAFIDENDLGGVVRVTRNKTNADLLDAIADALENEHHDNPEVHEPQAPVIAQEPEEEPEEEPETPAEEESNEEPEPEADEDEEEPAQPERSARGEHNDDTNEPAVRHSRRTARAVRRSRA